jgi:hypothetical protein
MTPPVDDDDPAEQGKHGDRDLPGEGAEGRQREPERPEVDDPERRSER